jgi:membrane fusion protein (multidrug efflux system)
LLGAATLAGCGGGKDAQAKGADAPPGAAAMAMPVEVAVARRDTVIDAIDATGQIEAEQQIELRPEVEGRLVAIYAREGQLVARGTPLFKVDDAELKAQVARAEADRDLAKQALTRTRELIAQRASAQSELEQAEAKARSTQADLDLLQVRLERTTVRAPFAGVVGRRLVSLGDYVTTSKSLITLQTFDPQRAVLQVPERYAEKLGIGQKVGFTVAALPGRTFEGTVDFVDPVVQLPGRTITAKARVPNPRRELQAGMFIQARLASAVRPQAVVIPEDAVLSLQGSQIVWVIDGASKATRRTVGLGVRTPGFVEVTNGVQAGEQVVVGGAERLAEGVPVRATVVKRQRAVTTEGRS